MLKEAVKQNWKFALKMFFGYMVIVLVSGIISSRLSGISWQDILYAGGSLILWTVILIPGILVLLINLVPFQIFIPMFIVIFGAFLLISALPEFGNIGKAIKGAVDIELFASGTAVVAIGLAFLQLYRKPSYTAKELKMVRDDLDKSERIVEGLDKSIKGLKARIKDLRRNTDDTKEKD